MASYIQAGGNLISEKRSGTSKFYHEDSLGTTRAITNASGTVTDSLDTDGFGMTVVGSGSTPTPFGFAGKHGYQSDSETGLMRLGHRYYDASAGRFISRDPIQDGYNWYAYCNNDPVNKIDPTGQFLIAVAVLIIVGGLLLGGDMPVTPPPTYGTPEVAAGAIGKPYMDDNIEHGGYIIVQPVPSVDDGSVYLPIESGHGTEDSFYYGPQPDGAVATWHTHPPGSANASSNIDQYSSDQSGMLGISLQQDGTMLENIPRPGHQGDPRPTEGNGPTDSHGIYPGYVMPGGHWK